MAYYELGEGWPVVLLHGFCSTAQDNWIRPGHAAQIVAQGYRLILPDLRAHGQSACPHDPAAYTRDVLADDGFALIEALGLRQYDLGGYSLGARTTARMLARGARPRKVILGGQSFESLTGTPGMGDYFRRVLSMPGRFAEGTPEFRTDRYLTRIGADRTALLLSQAGREQIPPEVLTGLDQPVLAVLGAEDPRDGATLAARIPDCRHVTLPGSHMSVIGKPEALGAAIAEFLGQAPRPA
ncbi:alpha/beta hydrolase [Thioclava sp. BHET1]|nr:alpha/beta hydrolase [Thioclava sp. BHET1]